MKMKCGHESDSFQKTIGGIDLPICINCNCYEPHDDTLIKKTDCIFNLYQQDSYCDFYHCNQCNGVGIATRNPPKYCPNCGRKVIKITK